MAKKKQKRRSGPGRAGAGAATTTTNRAGGRTQGPNEAEAPVKAAPASPGGPNRLERKEAARQARERLRRKAARRRMFKRTAIVVAVGAVIAGVVVLSTRPEGSPLNAEEKSLLAAAPAALTSAGCDPDIKKIGLYQNNDALDHTHIGNADAPTSPPLSNYASIPPVSGPHNPQPLPGGEYSAPPDIYQAIHSLEHGAVIIWYSPDAASDPTVAADLAKLQDFFGKTREQEKVIVAPFDYPDQGDAGKLPAGKQMVLAAWHHLQTCDSISLPVAYDFVVHYRTPAPKGEKYLGDAREPDAPIG
jgi:hypothetical protein